MAGNRPAAFERIEAMLPAARDVADARTLALALGLAATLVWYMRHDLQQARAYAA
jgi:hypothetical protein